MTELWSWVCGPVFFAHSVYRWKLGSPTGRSTMESLKINKHETEAEDIDLLSAAGRAKWWTHTHTHTHLTALGPALPGWAGTRKVKPIWILLKQETVSGSGISWAICKSASRSRQITIPWYQHPTTQFLQAGCPSCRPANSIKALKAEREMMYNAVKITNTKKSEIFTARTLQFSQT